jgi:DNA-binding IclR family transcriptional regulator
MHQQSRRRVVAVPVRHEHPGDTEGVPRRRHHQVRELLMDELMDVAVEVAHVRALGNRCATACFVIPSSSPISRSLKLERRMPAIATSHA